VTVLLGNAKSSVTEAPGSGIRMFTLQNYGPFGWVTGLLDSRDNRNQPISTRVVLVPADQHRRGKSLSFDPADETFIAYLSERVVPDETKMVPTANKGEAKPMGLEQEIEIDADDVHLLRGLAVSDLIRSLIWNGSLRTLHGEPQPIPQPKDHKGLVRLLNLQESALELEMHRSNDVHFFMRLLADDEVNTAIEAFLKRLKERSEK
jgi:hypothetical protein